MQSACPSPGPLLPPSPWPGCQAWAACNIAVPEPVEHQALSGSSFSVTCGSQDTPISNGWITIHSRAARTTGNLRAVQEAGQHQSGQVSGANPPLAPSRSGSVTPQSSPTGQAFCYVEGTQRLVEVPILKVVTVNIVLLEESVLAVSPVTAGSSRTPLSDLVDPRNDCFSGRESPAGPLWERECGEDHHDLHCLHQDRIPWARRKPQG